MITSPDKIKFESRNDVIDYVTKGFPPTKKNYAKVKAIVAKSDAVGLDEHSIDAELFNSMLDRVYHDQVRNRNIMIGIAAGLTVSIIVGSVISAGSAKEQTPAYGQQI